jgi:hypothetical protein
LPVALALTAFDELDEQELAVRILVVRQVLAVQLRLDRMHDHPRQHVVDPEVAAAFAVTHHRDNGLGLALGLLAGHGTRSLESLVFLEHGQRHIIHLGKARLPFPFRRGVALEQAEGHGAAENDERQEHETIKAPGNGETLHGTPLMCNSP